MTNVSFKRGRAANLPTTAQDGVFYLTTDTNRLYVGQGDKLAELNKYIRQVETVNNLPAPSDRAVGDFVHVKSGNMLLVCKDTTSILEMSFKPVSFLPAFTSSVSIRTET